MKQLQAAAPLGRRQLDEKKWVDFFVLDERAAAVLEREQTAFV